MVGISSLEMVKRAMRVLWTDVMTVEGVVPEEDTDTKITSHDSNVLYENEPCRISFHNISVVTGGNFPQQNQIIKLFCDETLVIPPGSTITVIRQGKPVKYYQSGMPALYPTHQEILLDLEDQYG